MLKYISAPDFHFSPDWIDTSIMCGNAIIAKAEAEEVDLIILGGDFWDRPVYATDKGGLTEARTIVARMRKVCPVVAVEGTPSHDARGAYDPLDVMVLQPGVIYGLMGGYRIEELNPDRGFCHPEFVLFGFPEITKDFIQSSNPNTSADEVNALAVEYMTRIIAERVAPLRAMVQRIPAIGILHGNVSDASRETETDVILKASDIVLKTDALSAAGIDRWELGHIHIPWESKKINAGYSGYAGMDRNPWGKTGFVPAFNLGTIDEKTHEVTIERIPYGTPMRMKIDKPLEIYDPSIAYWLESDNSSDVLPAGHPWNRITYKETATVSRRVEASEIPDTLHDLAKVYAPDLLPSIIEKIKEIESKTERPALAPRSIEVLSVEVTGAKFWGGLTVSLGVQALRTGLTQLAGANGSGKSSLAGFCTPYPCFIGKDTESGRLSAIKDFFQEPVSAIKKTIRYNGDLHEHMITIRGAHTKAPKVECYLSVKGQPILGKTSFDEMMDACESMYGPLSDYLMTSFYVQPLQGKAESGLMTANMTTVRDLVQTIAGIDRSAEKEYALGKVRTLQAETDRERTKIDAARAEAPDCDAISSEISFLESGLHGVRLNIPLLSRNVENAHKALDFKKLEAAGEEAKAARSAKLETEIRTGLRTIQDMRTRADDARLAITRLPFLRESIAKYEKDKLEYDEAMKLRTSVESENASARAAWQEARAESESLARKRADRLAQVKAEIQAIKDARDSAYNLDMSMWREAESNRKDILSRNALAEKEISLIKPCPQCGYLDDDAETRVASLRATIRREIVQSPEPMLPELVIPDALAFELAILKTPELDFNETLIQKSLPEVYMPDGSMIESIRRRIEEFVSASAILDGLEKAIPEAETALAVLVSEQESIMVRKISIDAERESFDNATKILSETTAGIARTEATIASKREIIANAVARERELSVRENELADALMDLGDWTKIDAMLSPSKLPAMELEVFLDSIDREATRMAAPYRSGRYSFKTITQKGDIDRFDIRIHDAETGRERSFLQYSVGEKSFFNDAYVKALVRVRKSRMRTSFSPVIMDEADSFIEIPMIPQFYEMQRNYYTDSDTRAIIITHSPDAGNYIENALNMTEVMR